MRLDKRSRRALKGLRRIKNQVAKRAAESPSKAIGANLVAIESVLVRLPSQGTSKPGADLFRAGKGDKPKFSIDREPRLKYAPKGRLTVKRFATA